MRGALETMKFVLLIIIPFGILIQSCENEDSKWVTIDPIQCMGNPWEQAWLQENNNSHDLWTEMGDQDKLDVFEEFYNNKGIVIYNIKCTEPHEDTCAACSCPRGDRIHCHIHEDDVDQMLEWGFEIE